MVQMTYAETWQAFQRLSDREQAAFWVGWQPRVQALADNGSDEDELSAFTAETMAAWIMVGPQIRSNNMPPDN